jgi:hypothetical protein
LGKFGAGMDELAIFISHAHEDRALALAWQELIYSITATRVRPWYSSDERMGGGMGPGDWRRLVHQKVRESTMILVLLTPGSNERPWLVWESGLAEGQSKEVIPVTFFMNERGLHEVFRNKQWFEGDKRSGVEKLVRELMLRVTGRPLEDFILESWRVSIERYLAAVATERRSSLARALFHDHFHDRHAAEQLSGNWTAMWTEVGEDGTETPFETDTLECWTTDSRIRFIGTSAKGGIDGLLDADEDERYYPMEGVVSADGWLALSYWSAREVRICGSVVMRRKGSSGVLLEGWWQGHTARNVLEEPRFVQGRVTMGKGELGRSLMGLPKV